MTQTPPPGGGNPYEDPYGQNFQGEGHEGQSHGSEPPTYPSYGSPPPSGQPYGAASSGSQPYGGQQPYVASGFGMPQQPAGKGMAITALVLAFIPCILTNIISSVLAVIVLVKSKAGRDHGKVLAIIAIVVNVLVLVASVGFIAVAIATSFSVSDLKTGQCITAKGLSGSADEVSDIDTVSCSESHNGEVLAMVTITQDQVDAYEESSQEGTEAVCGPEIDDADLVDAAGRGFQVTALSQDVPPEAGDPIACIAHKDNGDRTKGKVFE